MIKKMHKLKEVIVLRDKGSEDVITINELLNRRLDVNLDEFISKKDRANDDINSIFKTLYSEDVYDLIETVGTCVREKREIVDEKFSVEQIDQLERHHREITGAHTKLDTLTHEKLIHAYDKLTAEVNNTENLKNDLVKRMSEDLYNKMKESLESFKTEYDQLVQNMAEYEREEKILEQSMEEALKNEEEHFNTLQVDGQALKDTYNCTVFDKLKGSLLQRELELSQKMDHIKGLVTHIEKLLKYYRNLDKYFYLLGDSNYVERIEVLARNIQPEMMNKNISIEHDSFERSRESINKPLKIIECLNKTIHFHNHLNRSINECEDINKSINHLKGKIVSLKGELQKEIDEIRSSDLISEAVKIEVLAKLEAELGSVKTKLDETHMDDFLIKSTDLKKFYSDSKIDLHEKRQEYPVHDFLEKVNDWTEIKMAVNKLYHYYSTFEDNKVKLIITNSCIYLESIYNLIKDLIQKTWEKKDEMTEIFSSISKDNSSMYEDAKNFFDSVVKSIDTVTQTIRNMEKLIKENETIIEELKDQRWKLQNVGNAPTDLEKLEVNKMTPTKLETLSLERVERGKLKDDATDSTLKDDKETDNVKGEETKQENVMVTEGSHRQTEVYTSIVFKNDKNHQESEKIDEKKSIKPVSTGKNVGHSSYLNNNNSNKDSNIHSSYTPGGYNTPNDNHNTNVFGDDKNEETKENRNYVLFVYVGGLLSAFFIFIGPVLYLLNRKIRIAGVGKKSDKKNPTT
ncbi:hypothetical protein C922_01462 [Plasmodium inui San Antonio 1]|uniref:Uncharacterized protein n=1 Tax=Plasmodium inui San Antonio 1 TaxID=1237626 RepID=W7A844_9APIC|nr:hypothetical protein C922_01462 [Plasmodium inui San Antonio 1]EUD67850.1 hypothetical protein C922_01462 [Plasmodium inui San Antonio 1]